MTPNEPNEQTDEPIVTDDDAVEHVDERGPVDARPDDAGEPGE